MSFYSRDKTTNLLLNGILKLGIRTARVNCFFFLLKSFRNCNFFVICLLTKHSGISRTRLNVPGCSRSNWKLQVLVFEEMGKPGYIEKNEALGKPPDPFDNRFRFWHAPPGSVATQT